MQSRSVGKTEHCARLIALSKRPIILSMYNPAEAPHGRIQHVRFAGEGAAPSKAGSGRHPIDHMLRSLGKSQTPLGVKAIADALGLVTSTCLHILRVLVDEKLVRMDPETKRYQPGCGHAFTRPSVMECNIFPQAEFQPVLDRLSTRWNVTTIGVESSSWIT